MNTEMDYSTAAIRNAEYNALGGIDCELEHPDYGWMPFSAARGTGEHHMQTIWQRLKELDVAPFVPPDPVDELALEREGMVCSPLQGRMILGEDVCDMLDALSADPKTPWAMRQAILYATQWHRTSQAMTEMAYLLQYTDEQMDVLFRQAMAISV